MKPYAKSLIYGALTGLAVAGIFIAILTLTGCATAVSPTATVPPPNLLDQPHVQFDGTHTKRTQSFIAPRVYHRSVSWDYFEPMPAENLLDRYRLTTTNQPPAQFDRLTQSVIAPPPITADDPPPGVVIPLASSSAPSDFFTTTNLGSPWVYRTDDLRLVTNADGTTSGSFTNSPPTTQEFYLIVPLGQPLPSNIVTNSTTGF